MGCDIHMHTEVKINGKWHHYSTPDVGRNYDLFAYMAGVRNRGDIEPLTEPRGIPEDATELTRWCSNLDGADGHSHSWLGASEIAKVADFAAARGWKGRHGESWWESDTFGYLFLGDWSGFTKFPDGRDCEDIRWVFWFDN